MHKFEQVSAWGGLCKVKIEPTKDEAHGWERTALGQRSPCTLEGKTPLGIAHERPPKLPNPYAQGFDVKRQTFVGPKAHIRVCQGRKESRSYVL